MKAFIKTLYALLAIGVLTILIDNKIFNGSLTGVDKNTINYFLSSFTSSEYNQERTTATVYAPDNSQCMYYLKDASGNTYLPENLDPKFKVNALKVKIDWSELLKVQDECKRGTFVRIHTIQKF